MLVWYHVLADRALGREAATARGPEDELHIISIPLYNYEDYQMHSYHVPRRRWKQSERTASRKAEGNS